MYNDIRYLIERFYQIQKHRLALGNQKRTLNKAGTPSEAIDLHYKNFQAIEKSIKKSIEQPIKKHPIWKSYLKGVKGIGPILAAALISTIDIAKAQHASSVWKYAGLAPDQKREKGKKLDFNPFLKMTCWKIGGSLLISGPSGASWKGCQ